MHKPSFVNLPKPFISCVLTDAQPENAIATIRNGECDGAQAFDLHLRALELKYHNEKDLTRIVMASYRPMLMIYYRENDRWPQKLSDEDRARAHLLAVRCGASACDIMGDFYCESEHQLCMKPEIVDRQRTLIDSIHSAGGEVLMSSHVWEAMSCEQAVEHMKVLESRGPDMVKLACCANTEEELLESLRTTVVLKNELKVPFVHIVMGQYGKIHRFVGPMLGSSLIFTVQSYTADGHKEQPLVRGAKAVFDNFDWRVARNVESISR